MRINWLGYSCWWFVLSTLISPTVWGQREESATPRHAPSDREWGCYDAKPGHPTKADKADFLHKVQPIAQAAEEQFGTPAAGLIAMTMLESGYGWTRTALYANNYLGYKFTGPDAAGGRPAWTLDCQPDSDQNKNYIKFQNLEDNINFVAEKLARSKRYKKVTQHYQMANKGSSPNQQAIDTWVEQIASSGYNPDPTYPKRVEKVLHNYMTPSDAVSPTLNLYSSYEK